MNITNLKQMAAALQYLQENNLLIYEDLAAKAEAAAERFYTTGESLKVTETAMKRNADLKAAIVDYARTRPVFDEYKAKKYSNKYLAEHGDDISDYRAAQATMREILNGEKLPKTDALNDEGVDTPAVSYYKQTGKRATRGDSCPQWGSFGGIFRTTGTARPTYKDG